MNFGFTEEQELLRSEVRKYLDENVPLEEVRKIADTPAGFSRETWKQIAELGWLGLTIPESHGGAGLGFVDWVVVLEETGRSLLPTPLVSSTLAAQALCWAGSEAQQKRWLPALAEGTTIGTLALLEQSDSHDASGISLRAESAAGDFTLRGEKLFVADAAAADLFVVSFRLGAGTEDGSDPVAFALVSRDQSGVSAQDVPGIDLTKRLGRLGLDGVRVSREDILPGGGAALLQRLVDAGAAAVSAEAIGAAEAALALTAGYAVERTQFGRPIGTFQGVKHPLAEMYVDIESFKSLVCYAAWCLDEDHVDASLAVSRAKAYASEAFARIGLDAVQLHGGIGYTWEYDAQLFLKRAKWMRPMFGDADWHYERVARLGGL